MDSFVDMKTLSLQNALDGTKMQEALAGITFSEIEENPQKVSGRLDTHIENDLIEKLYDEQEFISNNNLEAKHLDEGERTIELDSKVVLSKNGYAEEINHTCCASTNIQSELNGGEDASSAFFDTRYILENKDKLHEEKQIIDTDIYIGKEILTNILPSICNGFFDIEDDITSNGSDIVDETKQSSNNCSSNENEQMRLGTAMEYNLEKDFVLSVITERNALCEEKICQKMLGTCEKLFVLLRKDNIYELQKQYNEKQSETGANKKIKWKRWRSNQPNKFWCKVCPFFSNNKRDLTVHIVERHKEVAIKKKLAPAECMTSGEDPNVIWYKCMDCAFVTSNRWVFHTHALRHQPMNESEALRCASCSFKTMVRSSLIKHVRLHSGTFHKCIYCDFQTKHFKYMSKHVRMLHDTEVEMIKCKKCSFQTKYKESYARHVLIHNTVRKLYKCPLCPFQTHYPEVLRNSHKITHTNDKARIYKCDFCPYKAKTKQNLSRHAQCHKSKDEVKMHKCGICSYQTRHKFYINNHRQTHQAVDEDNMHPCNLCSYQGKTAKHLQMHLNVHKKFEDCNTYKCKECLYQSKCSSNLIRHSLVHRKVEEITFFQCDKCEYRANSKARLKNHCNTVHKNPEEIKWFNCLTCNFKSKNKGNLQRHMLCHMDPNEANIYKCDLCSFSAKSKSEVKAHMPKHSKVYIKCDQCDFQTKYSSTLYNHRKREHPYSMKIKKSESLK